MHAWLEQVRAGEDVCSGGQLDGSAVCIFASLRVVQGIRTQSHGYPRSELILIPLRKARTHVTAHGTSLAGLLVEVVLCPSLFAHRLGKGSWCETAQEACVWSHTSDQVTRMPMLLPLLMRACHLH